MEVFGQPTWPIVKVTAVQEKCRLTLEDGVYGLSRNYETKHQPVPCDNPEERRLQSISGTYNTYLRVYKNTQKKTKGIRTDLLLAPATLMRIENYLDHVLIPNNAQIGA